MKAGMAAGKSTDAELKDFEDRNIGKMVEEKEIASITARIKVGGILDSKCYNQIKDLSFIIEENKEELFIKHQKHNNAMTMITYWIDAPNKNKNQVKEGRANIEIDLSVHQAALNKEMLKRVNVEENCKAT